MIKFFRKIRQKLLAQNKFSKYLLYAVGEIVLVVIGILIALQINNWNEDRIQSRKELKSLEMLTSEFQSNHEILKEAIAFQTERAEAIKTLLFEDLNEFEITELDSLYKVSFYGLTYNPSFSAYNSLVSSGELNLLSNDSLKISLSQFKDLIFDYQEDEVNIWHYSRDNLFPSEVLNEEMLTETKFNLRPRTTSEVEDDISKYFDYFQRPVIRNHFALMILHLDLTINEGVELDKRFGVITNTLKSEIRIFMET